MEKGGRKKESTKSLKSATYLRQCLSLTDLAILQALGSILPTSAGIMVHTTAPGFMPQPSDEIQGFTPYSNSASTETPSRKSLFITFNSPGGLLKVCSCRPRLYSLLCGLCRPAHLSSRPSCCSFSGNTFT